MTPLHHPTFQTRAHPTTPGLWAIRCLVCGEGHVSTHRPRLEQWKRDHAAAMRGGAA